MNDRMTELYAKACLDARDIHPTDVPAFIACMAENFAQLIVQECITEFEKYSTVDYASIKVKEHFGVE